MYNSSSVPKTDQANFFGTLVDCFYLGDLPACFNNPSSLQYKQLIAHWLLNNKNVYFAKLYIYIHKQYEVQLLQINLLKVHCIPKISQPSLVKAQHKAWPNLNKLASLEAMLVWNKLCVTDQTTGFLDWAIAKNLEMLHYEAEPQGMVVQIYQIGHTSVGLLWLKRLTTGLVE